MTLTQNRLLFARVSCYWFARTVLSMDACSRLCPSPRLRSWIFLPNVLLLVSIRQVCCSLVVTLVHRLVLVAVSWRTFIVEFPTIRVVAADDWIPPILGYDMACLQFGFGSMRIPGVASLFRYVRISLVVSARRRPGSAVVFLLLPCLPSLQVQHRPFSFVQPQVLQP
jgi:hypothetical protein